MQRCLTKQEFFDYYNNMLIGEDLRRIKTHIASCKLCEAATQGLRYLNEDEFNQDLDSLLKEIML